MLCFSLMKNKRVFLSCNDNHGQNIYKTCFQFPRVGMIFAYAFFTQNLEPRGYGGLLMCIIEAHSDSIRNDINNFSTLCIARAGSCFRRLQIF